MVHVTKCVCAGSRRRFACLAIVVGILCASLFSQWFPCLAIHAYPEEDCLSFDAFNHSHSRIRQVLSLARLATAPTKQPQAMPYARPNGTTCQRRIASCLVFVTHLEPIMHDFALPCLSLVPCLITSCTILVA